MPLLVAFFAIPILIKSLGTDRFGIITIAWMLIGYLSLFDMGLGRALTQLVAERLGKNDLEEIPAIFWTSSVIILLFSIAGAVIFMAIASPLVHGVLKIPSQLQHETLLSLYLLAGSLPFVILTSALIGFLSAYQRFDIINAIRVPLGIYNYIGPLLILPFSSGLVPMIAALIVGRGVAFFIHLLWCLKIAPKLKETVTVRWSLAMPLFRFGGWMTVSNIIGPVMVYFDRFLIGSVISVAAVAYYTTPYELVTKLWIIPTALINVLFPTFATTYTQDSQHAMKFFASAVKYLLLCLFPITLVIVAGAHQGLELWLGGDFADKSYRVLQWLAMGVFVNSLAQVPFAFLQGVGKPETTSKVHLVELVLYLPVLWWLVSHYGIEGAAIAWFGRVAVDTACLFVLAWRYYRPNSGLVSSTRYSIVFGMLVLFAVAMTPEIHMRYALTTVVLLLFSLYAWKVVLSRDDHAYILSKLRS